MGQTLSEPVTEKHSDFAVGKKYAYAVSEMQGWRVSMEDAHTTLLDLDPENHPGHSFFAVFDGHGGSSVAKYSGTHVAQRLISDPAFDKEDYKQALINAFLGTDEDLRADPAFFHDPSGCTAVAAFITKDGKLFVANAGDSRAVISKKGFVQPLSYDHKPTNEKETERIVAAGGFVEYGRVNGNLALSRALGDFEFKNNHSLPAERQIVTAFPDIDERQIDEDDEFIVVACDGIWDCLTSQQVVDIVRRLAAQRKSLQEICETVIQRCCAPDADTGAGIGCDNMTMVVVAILHDRDLDGWYDLIESRVATSNGYSTPEELYQIYPESRILAAQQRAAYRSNSAFGNGSTITLRSGGFGALARVLGGGAISFNPSARTTNDSHVLSFEENDEDYEDDDEDEDTGDTGEGGLFGVHRLKVGAGGEGKDITRILKDQLDDLENGLDEDDDSDNSGTNSRFVDAEDSEMHDAFAPRANITLPSPSERQGMIDLDLVQDQQASSPNPSSGLEGDVDETGGQWMKLSGPTARSEVSVTGSPLVPTPTALKTFGKQGELIEEIDSTSETSPNPSSKADSQIPVQETGRVPDADKTPVITNGLLDKSEDPIKA